MPLPNFRPPRLSRLVRQANPLREVIDDARELVRSAGDSIKEVASSLHIEAPEEPISNEPEAPVSIKAVMEGTVCNLCSSEHFSQVSGDLAEAMRFARDKGLKHPEVIKRVEHARQELNEMERYDLSSATMETLSLAERKLAEWALPKSRNLRHMINKAITTKEVRDLEGAAAEAERTAAEFTKRLWDLPTQREESCPECGDLEDLKAFLERRRKER